MLRIVAGGQTGVDRGALEVALRRGIPCGGWCPAGRRAEDGPISERFPLQETEVADYSVRTERNVVETDGTLIISTEPLTGGTLLTRRIAEQHAKPLLIVPPRGLFLADLIQDWLQQHKIQNLNIAGPRESMVPGIQAETEALLENWLNEHHP